MHPVQLKAPAFFRWVTVMDPWGFAPGGEGAVEAERAIEPGAERGASSERFTYYPSRGFRAGLSASARRPASRRCSSVSAYGAALPAHAHAGAAVKSGRRMGELHRFWRTGALGIRMHPPAEQFRGGEVACLLFSAPRASLESGAEERRDGSTCSAGSAPYRVPLVISDATCSRSRSFPGGDLNRQMHAHVEPFQSPVVQLFQAEGNKLFEQVRAADGAEQVGGEQFQPARIRRVSLVCFVERGRGSAGVTRWCRSARACTSDATGARGILAGDYGAEAAPRGDGLTPQLW